MWVFRIDENVSGREKFRQMSVAEFFKRNRSVAGFSNPSRSVYQTVRELVENALDATENHGILPNIRLAIYKRGKTANLDLLEIVCRDNGIGVPPSKVPDAFARVLYGSKYVNRQSRGLFGMGVKMAVLYAQMTTGKPVRVATAQPGCGVEHVFELKIDVKKNRPMVLRHEKREAKTHGTEVKLVIAGDWSRARRYVLEYIERTAAVTPYAEIVFTYPENSGYKTVRYERSTEEMPPPPKVKRPHPYGVDLETLKEMLAEAKPNQLLWRFLESRFERVGEKSAIQLVKSIGFSERKTVGGLRHGDIKRLYEALQTWKWPRPSGDGLSPLGTELLVAGLRRVYEPEFVYAVTRPPAAYGGHAFIVEAAVAWGGGIPSMDKPLLLRYLNRIPVLYDESDCAITKLVRSIDLSNYGLQPPSPLLILVHVVATRLPFKGLGKEALADVPEVSKEVELAVREALRRVSRAVKRKRREEEERRRRAEILMYARMVGLGLENMGVMNADDAVQLVKNILERS